MTNAYVQFNGPLSLDFTPLEGTVINAISGVTRGVRREKEGIEKVLAELQQNLPIHAAVLGIAPDVHTRTATLTEKLAKVRAARVLTETLTRALSETEVMLEDEREGEIALVVDAVRRTAVRKDPAIAASFDETIRYHGQIATRAYKTRRKKQGPAKPEPQKPAGAQTQTHTS